jgi:hypothetical protein
MHRLTPLDVARPQFQIAFGVDAPRPQSTASEHTIKPAHSSSSLSSFSYPSVPSTPRLLSPQASPSATLTRELLDMLDALPSDSAACPQEEDEQGQMQELLERAGEVGRELLGRFQERATRVIGEIQRARRRHARLVALADATALSLEDRLGARRATGRKRSESAHARRRTTDSAESEATKVEAEQPSPRSFMSMSTTSLAAAKGRRDRAASKAERVAMGLLDALKHAAEGATTLKIPAAKDGETRTAHAAQADGTGGRGGLRRRVKSYADVRGRAKTWAWLKGKLKVEHPALTEEGGDASEESNGRVKAVEDDDEDGAETRSALRRAHATMVAASRDLADVDIWMTTVSPDGFCENGWVANVTSQPKTDDLMLRVNDSIKHAERVFERCIKACVKSFTPTEPP